MCAFGVLNIGNTFTNGLLDSTVQGSTNGTIGNASGSNGTNVTNIWQQTMQLKYSMENLPTMVPLVQGSLVTMSRGGLLSEKVISSYVSY